MTSIAPADFDAESTQRDANLCEATKKTDGRLCTNAKKDCLKTCRIKAHLSQLSKSYEIEKKMGTVGNGKSIELLVHLVL